MKKPLISSRSGYSLIEMVLVIGAITVLLGLCAGMIHRLLKLDRVARAHLTETATVARLARQFRQDVRASMRAEPGGDADHPGSVLELSRSDNEWVSYRPEGRSLIRTHRRTGQVDRRESYALPRRGTPRFEVLDEGQAILVSLQLRPPVAEPRGFGPTELRIEALLNRDARLAKPEGTSR